MTVDRLQVPFSVTASAPLFQQASQKYARVQKKKKKANSKALQCDLILCNASYFLSNHSQQTEATWLPLSRARALLRTTTFRD